jgi:hypothetical protein
MTRRKRASGRDRAGSGRELYRRLAGGLVWVLLPLALTAWGLHLVATALAGLAGTELSSVWERLGTTFGTSGDVVRLVLFGAIHAGIAISVLPHLEEGVRRGQNLARTVDRALAARSRQWVELRRGWARYRLPLAVRKPLDLGASVLATGVLVAFLVQPTLVPLHLDRQAWVQRAANLVDGTASAYLVDSVVGLARSLYAPPVEPAAPVNPEDFDNDLDKDVIPLIDRWDRDLLAAADGDLELFAQTKAFMWVESGGRQFALSSTGCAGLMQFCASTAQGSPFGGIFGVGQVAACGCHDCSVPREVQIALETDPEAVLAHKDTFPCDLSDARFDPQRSILAGVAYVRQLGDRFGHHLPLMYIGYNSGPSVASSLHRTLKDQPDVTIESLRPHLANALRPYHGSRADGRANGLLEVHLPKLMAAYERWRP